ncbi:uncharacterized protein SPAPADRAFT_65124 [Spathaspora passalidarum NRRL Y-27907]|uniref:Uncharacterized protein n=1 Tax=Spathaspora passalidarum (strain NRRL Y-27907 / 11-Y1) TaxID=619300 RepID=G3AJL9_SPAPN|nr:uncharacterized protein SPAPADRAFT_65124 [Spathaspora passalidarum NRRL Y-27907]EGW33919.1 hypothetical protein SPAPADRAFT_65124 [Spathaspora passalidarum NRRL Y-27907]
MSHISPEQEKIAILKHHLNATLETFNSAHELVENSESIIRGATDETPQALKKQFILDSFKITKTHKDYKHWELEQANQFIDNGIFEYNRVIASIHRVNTHLEKLTEEYEQIAKTVTIPEFQFSVKTLEIYGDESLLKLIPEGAKIVKLSELFSLDPKSNLAMLDYQVISKLINIEFKLRIELRIKYEILNVIKTKVMANNSKWSARNNYLQDFLDKKLAAAFNEVEKVKNAEGVSVKQAESDMSDIEEDEANMQEIEEEEEESEDEHIEDERHIEEERVEEHIEEEHAEEHIEEDIDIEDKPSTDDLSVAPTRPSAEPSDDDEDDEMLI